MKMTQNVKGPERVFRLVAGSGLLVGAYFVPGGMIVQALMGVVGLYWLGSGIAHFCILKAVMGSEAKQDA